MTRPILTSCDLSGLYKCLSLVQMFVQMFISWNFHILSLKLEGPSETDQVSVRPLKTILFQLQKLEIFPNSATCTVMEQVNVPS